jgi:uncharacterized membrane protein
MRPAKIVAIVIGAFLALVGFVMLISGVFLLGFTGILSDDSGFVQTSTRSVSTSGYAVVSPDLELNIGPNDWDWAPSGNELAFRIKASAIDSSAVFVGIGPSSEVAAYLEGVAYDEVTNYAWTSSQVDYRHFDGGAPSSLPGEQTFWVASVQGPGDQDLRWNISDGDWTGVVMNADASAPVAVNLSLGARFGLLTPIGIALVVAGVVLLAGGIVLIVLGARRPREARTPQVPGGWMPPQGAGEWQQPPSGSGVAPGWSTPPSPSGPTQSPPREEPGAAGDERP